MALEAVVFQQDPYSYGSRDTGLHSLFFDHQNGVCFDSKRDSSSSPPPPPPIAQTLASSTASSSSPESSFSGNGLIDIVGCPPGEAPRGKARKRRRISNVKNKEEIENQRMTHIAVERNRRRQMNYHLSVLKSLMPPSYVQRGDQASVVGGAINFLKELEQLLQSLEAHKSTQQSPKHNISGTTPSSLFSDFFVFPQYTTTSAAAPRHHHHYQNHHGSGEKPPGAVADIEVTMVESHANLKILTKGQPRQLFKIVNRLHSLGLDILHVNVTTARHMVLSTFSMKVEDDCQMTSGNEIATAVHEMVERIQQEADFS